MKAMVVCFFLFWASLGGTRAQQATGVKALDGLVAAVNAKSAEALQPYVTPQTRIGSLPAAYSPQVLAQLMPKFGPIEQIRVVRQQAEGSNTRYVCAITRPGGEKEYDFLVAPDGTFLEINIAQASVKKIDTTFSPQDLTTPSAAEIPARLVKGLWLVEAEVDGRKGTFVLDSGAPALMLNKRDFVAPNAQNVAGSAGLQGVNGGLAGMSYYPVQQFNWAGISFRQKEVPTLDLSAIEQKLDGVTLLGLIGQNLLTQYAMTLDYHAARVVLQKPGAAISPDPRTVSIPFALRGHLPIVEVIADGQMYRLALDCGAQSNVLDAQFEPAFANKLRRRSHDVLHGADHAARSVTSGELPKLEMGGGLAFHKQKIVFADISHLNQRAGQLPVQGIAGYPLLSQYRTTIDYVNQQVHFTSW